MAVVFIRHVIKSVGRNREGMTQPVVQDSSNGHLFPVVAFGAKFFSRVLLGHSENWFVQTPRWTGLRTFFNQKFAVSTTSIRHWLTSVIGQFCPGTSLRFYLSLAFSVTIGRRASVYLFLLTNVSVCNLGTKTSLRTTKRLLPPLKKREGKDLILFVLFWLSERGGIKTIEWKSICGSHIYVGTSLTCDWSFH